MDILQEYIMHDEQKDVDKFFDIAKSKDLNFADNIHNYMFMYRSKMNCISKIEIQKNI